MIKLLQICNKAPFPANDGSSIAIYNMAKGFIVNKVDLHLLTINTKKHFKPDNDVPAEFRKNSNYVSVYGNTNTSLAGAFFNLFSSSSYFVSRFFFRAFEKKLIETLNNHSFDIVQLEGLSMGVYIDTIKKHSKARIVLRAHNIEHFIWQRHIANEGFNLKKLYLSLQNKRLRRFELNVLAKVDAVIPITKNDELELKNLSKNLSVKKPFFTCITGVDIMEYQTRLAINEKQKTVFCFGSMDWLPNQVAATWFLNNCWSQVHKKVPDAKLIIAGRGMPLDFFHITMPNVVIVENVENAKEVFQQYQVMIVPLRSGSGLRIKIIEGMAYGKAIVSTSIGAEGINYSDGKNILIADSAKDFIERVVELLSDNDKRKQLEQNAVEFAKNEFDNLQVVSRLVEFYKQQLNV